MIHDPVITLRGLLPQDPVVGLPLSDEQLEAIKTGLACATAALKVALPSNVSLERETWIPSVSPCGLR